MKAVLLVPTPGDPHGLLHGTRLPHSPGVTVEHGAMPVYCDLVPLARRRELRVGDGAAGGGGWVVQLDRAP